MIGNDEVFCFKPHLRTVQLIIQAVTYDYWIAVRLGGNQHYHSASEADSFCSSWWVSSCLA